MTSALLGIFVGGASRRMGGRPKGLLVAPESGEPLVERLVREGRAAGLEPVLVGEASGYIEVARGVARIADAPAGMGPLGGLAALLAEAGDRDAIAVACDMPYVEADVLRRVAEHPSEAAVVAPRRGGRWEPLLARYRSPRVRSAVEAALAEGTRSFQALFGRLDVDVLAVDDALERALTDWDAPDQVGA